MKKESILYGIHPLLTAIESGKNLDKVMLQRGLSPETLHKILPALKAAEIPFQFVPKIKLDRITQKTHQGIIATISPIDFQDLEWLVPTIFEAGEVPLILILDRISDIRNFGAICRTAECAGVHAVVLPVKGAAQINEDAIKTSSGALLRVPICRSTSLSSTLDFLKLSGLRALACHERGHTNYTQCNLHLPLAIVMGSEEDGISKNILECIDEGINIPLYGKTMSLNVSVASAIVLFETVRQRMSV